MDVASKLSSAQGERGEAANIALAKEICKTGDETALTVLFQIANSIPAPLSGPALFEDANFQKSRPHLLSARRDGHESPAA